VKPTRLKSSLVSKLEENLNWVSQNPSPLPHKLFMFGGEILEGYPVALKN